MALGDLSGDGYADLAYVNGFTNTISVRMNQGDGTFGATTDYPTDWYPYGIAIADLDADGRMDVAVTNTGSTVNTLCGTTRDGRRRARVAGELRHGLRAEHDLCRRSRRRWPSRISP